MLAATPGAARHVLQDSDPREMLSQHVDLVRDVIRIVALRQRLTETTLEDLESAVWMRLVENDYRAIRQYRGEASFRTFLRVVVTRLLLDLRASAWGRWRPSARARHLGKTAVRFEALLFRDGHSIDQALRILESRGETLDDAAISTIASSVRSLPRRFVPIEEMPEQAAPWIEPELAVKPEVKARHSRTISAALARALQALSPADRKLLQMRHTEGLKVATIARALKQDQMRLYRRLNGLHAMMRRSIERAGITADDARELVGRNDVALPNVL